jgi:hypothetical protein
MFWRHPTPPRDKGDCVGRGVAQCDAATLFAPQRNNGWSGTVRMVLVTKRHGDLSSFA